MLKKERKHGRSPFVPFAVLVEGVGGEERERAFNDSEGSNKLTKFPFCILLEIGFRCVVRFTWFLLLIPLIGCL